MNPAKIIRQAFSFICLSGVGWIVDFGTYILLISIFDLNIILANAISAIPAVTLVFFISTKKVFAKNNNGIEIKYKYLIYFVYQLILVLCISTLGEYLYNIVLEVNWINGSIILQYLKIIIKIVITPITMTLNFIIMKCLLEKL